jgi:hypothetical protein
VLAVPTFIWLPREFDDIKTVLDEVSVAANDASKNAAAAAVNSEKTAQSQDALTLEIAKWQAVPIGLLDNIPASMKEGFLVGNRSQSYMSGEAFLSYFPADVKQNVQDAALLSAFSYADFVGSEWIFVAEPKFNELTAEDQRIIQERLFSSGIRFTVIE